MPGDGPLGTREISFYAKCMFGGVLACGVTHAAVVSLDVAKCRAQVIIIFFFHIISTF